MIHEDLKWLNSDDDIDTTLELSPSILDAVWGINHRNKGFFVEGIDNLVYGIIYRERDKLFDCEDGTITFEDVLSWQKEISGFIENFTEYTYSKSGNSVILDDDNEDISLESDLTYYDDLYRKSKWLCTINGIRKSEKYKDFTILPTAYIEEHLPLIFPINIKIKDKEVSLNFGTGASFKIDNRFENKKLIRGYLNYWYQAFLHIYPLENDNFRMAEIVLNIVSNVIINESVVTKWW